VARKFKDHLGKRLKKKKRGGKENRGGPSQKGVLNGRLHKTPMPSLNRELAKKEKVKNTFSKTFPLPAAPQPPKKRIKRGSKKKKSTAGTEHSVLGERARKRRQTRRSL